MCNVHFLHIAFLIKNLLKEKAGIATLSFRIFDWLRSSLAKPVFRLSPFLDSILLCVSVTSKFSIEYICFAINDLLTYRHARICFAYAGDRGNFLQYFRNCSLVVKSSIFSLDHSFAAARKKQLSSYP